MLFSLRGGGWGSNFQKKHYVTLEWPLNVAPVIKMVMVTEKRQKWFGHVKRREGHMLRRMLDAPIVNTRKETDRKTENQEEREKTLVKAIWKVWVKGGGHIIQETVEEKVENHFRDP